MKPEPHANESTAAGVETDDIVLDVRDLAVHYTLQGNALSRLLGLRQRVVKAVDGVNMGIRRGEVVGLVGESGSGKTTLGRALLGLAPATGGSIGYRGKSGSAEVTELRGRELRQLRTDLQMVFQDPTAALNPSMTIAQAVGHPLLIHGKAERSEVRGRVAEALERVGLSPVESFLDKYPGDLSGGQKQRAVIARAIILDPEVLIADEPISMLDMSVRAKILQLMLDLKRDLGLTYVYITHDLASAKFFCDRIAIMYLGRVVEFGTAEEIFASPRHPYTKALLAAIPDPDPDRMLPRDLPRGEIPDAAAPPAGCAFHPRCPVAVAECGWEARDLDVLLEGHWTRHPDEYDAQQTGQAPSVELLERIKAEVPDDPFWRGVVDIAPGPSGADITFAEGIDPPLRQAGGVEVACHLYPEAGTD